MTIGANMFQQPYCSNDGMVTIHPYYGLTRCKKQLKSYLFEFGLSESSMFSQFLGLYVYFDPTYFLFFWEEGKQYIIVTSIFHCAASTRLFFSYTHKSLVCFDRITFSFLFQKDRILWFALLLIGWKWMSEWMLNDACLFKLSILRVFSLYNSGQLNLFLLMTSPPPPIFYYSTWIINHYFSC